MVGHDLIHNV